MQTHIPVCEGDRRCAGDVGRQRDLEVALALVAWSGQWANQEQVVSGQYQAPAVLLLSAVGFDLYRPVRGAEVQYLEGCQHKGVLSARHATGTLPTIALPHMQDSGRLQFGKVPCVPDMSTARPHQRSSSVWIVRSCDPSLLL